MKAIINGRPVTLDSDLVENIGEAEIIGGDRYLFRVRVHDESDTVLIPWLAVVICDQEENGLSAYDLEFSPKLNLDQVDCFVHASAMAKQDPELPDYDVLNMLIPHIATWRVVGNELLCVFEGHEGRATLTEEGVPLRHKPTRAETT